MTTSNRLPDLAYNGLLGEYIDLVSHTTEAPSEFHAGAFLAITGLLFGDAQLREGDYTLHPTFYIVTVGPTGSGKSTANSMAVKFARQVNDFPIIGATGSAQGLMEALVAAGNEDPGRNAMRLAQARTEGLLPETSEHDDVHGVGVPTLIRAGEVTSFFKQANRSVTSDMTEFVLELYDRPPTMRTQTRQRPIILVRPRATLLGDSTEPHLASTFNDSNVDNGLLNRMMLFTGDYDGDPIPRPPAPNEARYQRLVEKLKRLVDSFGPAPDVTWGETGATAHDALYRETLSARKRSDIGAVVAREDSHVKSLAMLFALLRGSLSIEAEDVAQAWAIVTYTSQNAISLSGHAAAGKRAQVLEYMERRLRDTGADGIKSAGYLRSKMTEQWRAKADDLGGIVPLFNQLTSDGRAIPRPGVGFVHPDFSEAA